MNPQASRWHEWPVRRKRLLRQLLLRQLLVLLRLLLLPARRTLC